MNEYLLLFRNVGGDAAYVSTVQDMADDMPRWQSWIGAMAMQGKLVSTHPIEFGGTIVSNDGVRKGPNRDNDNMLVSGYLICKAESVEEVQEWSKTCPILKYPHGSVEIRPITPFPIN